MSVYLCLALDDMDSYFKWLRIMVTLIISAIIKTKGRPETRHQILMVLDEFPCLRRMKIIEDAVAQLAGYGLSMFFVVQDFGQLKSVYKDNWETFVGNSGLKLIFGQNDHLFTAEYISKVLGQTEVSRFARQVGIAEGQTQSETQGTQISESKGTQTGTSTSHSESYTEGESNAHTEGRNTSWSETENESRTKGRNWGSSYQDGSSTNKSWNKGSGSNKNEGNSSNKNFKSGIFGLAQAFQFLPIVRTDNSASSSKNEGTGTSKQKGHGGGSSSNTSKTRNRGGNFSKTWGRSSTTGGGTNSSDTYTSNRSQTHGTTFQESQSETHSRTEGQSHQISEGTTTNRNRGLQENLQARPLIDVNEVKKWFSPISDKTSVDYPGYCLVLARDEEPTPIRRTNYFEEEHFLGWFDPHPDHPDTAPDEFIFQHKIEGLEVELTGQWLVHERESVDAQTGILRYGPIDYKKTSRLYREAYERIAEDFPQVDIEKESFYWTIATPLSGKIHLHGTQNIIAQIETNRRLFNREQFMLPRSKPPQELYNFHREVERHVELRQDQIKKERQERRAKKRRKEEERLARENAERIALEQAAARKAQQEADALVRAQKEAAEHKRKDKIKRLAIIGITVVALILLINAAVQQGRRQQELMALERAQDKIEAAKSNIALKGGFDPNKNPDLFNSLLQSVAQSDFELINNLANNYSAFHAIEKEQIKILTNTFGKTDSEARRILDNIHNGTKGILHYEDPNKGLSVNYIFLEKYIGYKPMYDAPSPFSEVPSFNLSNRKRNPQRLAAFFTFCKIQNAKIRISYIADTKDLTKSLIRNYDELRTILHYRDNPHEELPRFKSVRTRKMSIDEAMKYLQ